MLGMKLQFNVRRHFQQKIYQFYNIEEMNNKCDYIHIPNAIDGETPKKSVHFAGSLDYFPVSNIFSFEKTFIDMLGIMIWA